MSFDARTLHGVQKWVAEVMEDVALRCLDYVEYAGAERITTILISSHVPADRILLLLGPYRTASPSAQYERCDDCRLSQDKLFAVDDFKISITVAIRLR